MGTLVANGSAWATDLEAPIAATRAHVVKSPHGDRVDPYYWLRDDKREQPDVLAY
ncbi:MAG: hypothetical protein VKQ33_15135, partial [Candidatus Sericytochromatia bacterium]|nr:hypothetical protein [Candidatus Sericytochromatia bacterium]